MSPGWTRPDGTRPRSASPGRLDCPARCPTDWDWPCGWKEQLVPVGPWLLLTSSGRGRIGRRLPRPRPNVLGGPYSSLLKYRIDGGHHLLTAFPRPVRRGPARGDLRSVREALAAEPLVLDLCTETTGQSWRPFAVLTVRASLPVPPQRGLDFDAYVHSAPGFRPSSALAATRHAAYRNSRAGRRDGRAG